MPKTKSKSFIFSNHLRLSRSAVLTLAIALPAFYIIAPQLKYFHNTLHTISSADYAFVLWGLLFVFLSYVAAAATLILVNYFPLRFWPTVLIQVADGFTNRLLPAGAGNIATNVLYISRRSHDKVKAGAVVGINNLIGVIGHAILLFTLFMAGHTDGFHWSVKIPVSIKLFVLILVATLVVSLLIYGGLLKTKRVHAFFEVPKHLLRKPRRLLAALLCSILISSSYTLVLFSVMVALNVHVSLLQVFLILTAGVAANALTPTPGGVGGVEAGLVAAQVAFGVSAEQALSVAILFRALTFFLPMLLGVVALRAAIKSKYLII